MTDNRDSAAPTIVERVAAGAALLDSRSPGWHHQIESAFLDLGSCSECVLGQLFGSFGAGATTLGIAPSDDALTTEAHYGFDVVDGLVESYDELRTEWLQVIAERLAVA